MSALPRTGYHMCATDNEIHRRVSDNHVLVDRAASMFHYYRNTPATWPVISAKYRSRPSILSYLGHIYASEIEASGFFEGVDAIVPVPVHWTRRITRGYNQTDYLARGLSDATGLPVRRNLLTLPRRHETQTRRTAASRAANVDHTFAARSVSDPPAHILLVDDIITTGSTMHDCLRALHETFPQSRLSVLSIGLAHLH